MTTALVILGTTVALLLGGWLLRAGNRAATTRDAEADAKRESRTAGQMIDEQKKADAAIDAKAKTAEASTAKAATLPTHDTEADDIARAKRLIDPEEMP